MKQYHELVKRILVDGVRKEDRTGTGTVGVFGHQMEFDLREGFPLLTTKRMSFRNIAMELLWMLGGNTNVRWLQERGVTIWNDWQGPDGDLGPIYGRQWVSWPTPDGGTIDQMAWVVEEIKRNPNSRRLVVSAWNPGELSLMALPPCHCLFQFQVEGESLNCMMFQRSGDVFLGVPYNIASYALLTHMVAQVTGYQPGKFVHALGDAHLYLNHLDQARTLIGRPIRGLPVLGLNPALKDLFAFTYDDLYLYNYDPHLAIPAPVSV